MDMDFKAMFSSVERPYRYIGGEVGSRKSPLGDADVKICLVFPDTYEIGTSHIGLPILYHRLNSKAGVVAERAFCPWPDMEAYLEGNRIPLFSLESKRPLNEFDVVGLSLSYELTYTNVVTVLRCARIPTRAADRGNGDPVVIAGGPCAYNPRPVEAFFDAIVIGDGEDVALEIADAVADARRRGLPRTELLGLLSGISGVYVPSISKGGPIKRAIVADLDSVPLPASPIVPYASTQMRLAVEVARGCTHGCRFCQAGFIYRPLRQRSEGCALRAVSSGLANTGHEEFSFLSLSLGDWGPLEGALCKVQSSSRMPVAASLPSLRVESMTDRITSALGTGRAGSFTLAPEAATERMRRLINKGNTDAELYQSVEEIFKEGWHAIKLYFMIGLPSETKGDIDGIVDVANKCLDIGRRYHKRPDVTVSTSVFVPKAHTPFQWDAQVSPASAIEAERHLKARLRRPGLYYKWHNAHQSMLEGVFSRGGCELSDAIELAHRYGARLDGWDEHFRLEIWQRAFAELRIDPAGYLAERSEDYVFPWDSLGVGPDRRFLWEERKKAYDGIATGDCASGACAGCGLCDFETVKNRLAGPSVECASAADIPAPAISPAALTPHRYRIRYAKRGLAAYLGGIETLDAMRFALRASGLPLSYTKGFRVRPKVASGPALSVGIESELEFVDIELYEAVGRDDIIRAMDGKLPEGMSVVGAEELCAGCPSIEDSVAAFEYEVAICDLPPDAVARATDGFLARPSFVIRRERGKGPVDIDLKRAVSELAVPSGHVVRVAIENTRPMPRILEVVGAIYGLDDGGLRRVVVKKIGVRWKDGAGIGN
jgi:radical SAM family uncharacterized protein/radical SAM-linked protein